MRRFIGVISLLLTLLGSCAPVSTPTMTSRATATKAHTPTNRPTRTNTPTPKPTLTPTPIRPAFSGRIIALARSGLFELTPVEGSLEAEYTLIASNATGAAISPDLRYIVYATFSVDSSNRLTHLFDLETHTDLIILPDTANSISWSPNSRWVSFIAGFGSLEVEYGLYLYDVTSTAPRLVFKPDCAGYGFVNPQGVCGKFSAGIWIAPDTLLFQRYTGDLPAKVTTPFYPEVNSNTTTFVNVADGDQVLVDSPKRWFIQDSCGDQVLLREETEQAYIYSIADTAGFISAPGTIETTQIKSCPVDSNDCLNLYGIWNTGLPNGPYLQFVPGSCKLFYLTGEAFDRSLHIFDPGTLEDRSLPIPTFGVITFPSNFTWTDDWPDRPDSKVAVMSESMYPTIEIVDIQVAETSRIWSGKDLPNINPNTFNLLAWIVP